MSTKTAGKLTVAEVGSAEEAFNKIAGLQNQPTKHDVQQLKSVRDELCNRFREADKVLASQYPASSPTYRRAKKQSDKLTKQITAINNLIKFLETQVK